LGTADLIMSPVWNPCTRLTVFGLVNVPSFFLRRNPYLSVSHIWRCPRPIALICSGCIPSILSVSGVDLPTQNASNQCVLGKLQIDRLYLVRPPVPTSTGNPVTSRRHQIPHRVALSMAPWLVSQLPDTRTQRPFDHLSSSCRVDMIRLDY